MQNKNNNLKALFVAFVVILAAATSYYWARRESAEQAQNADRTPSRQQSADVEIMVLSD